MAAASAAPPAHQSARAVPLPATIRPAESAPASPPSSFPSAAWQSATTCPSPLCQLRCTSSAAPREYSAASTFRSPTTAPAQSSSPHHHAYTQTALPTDAARPLLQTASNPCAAYSQSVQFPKSPRHPPSFRCTVLPV